MQTAEVGLGDSISIDDFTGVSGGGAASQFAGLIKAETFQNLARNGFTTIDVETSLADISCMPDIITITCGGNDFLLSMMWTAQAPTNEPVERLLHRLHGILNRLETFGCQVIVNTIYDPTCGGGFTGSLITDQTVRLAFLELNEGIRRMTATNGFTLADLYPLFEGHCEGSSDPWLTQIIEPNLAGATAIARTWLGLVRDQ